MTPHAGRLFHCSSFFTRCSYRFHCHPNGPSTLLIENNNRYIKNVWSFPYSIPNESDMLFVSGNFVLKYALTWPKKFPHFESPRPQHPRKFNTNLRKVWLLWWWMFLHRLLLLLLLKQLLFSLLKWLHHIFIKQIHEIIRVRLCRFDMICFGKEVMDYAL